MKTEYRQEGLVTMIPRTSIPEKKLADLTFEEIQAMSSDLTEEEAASPFAKYYFEKTELPPEQAAALNGPPMNVEDAFEPWEYGENMNTPGYCPVENGYCVLPSGITYSAVLIRQPGRTNEKMDAYNKQFAPVGALAYKCWTPGAHYYHCTDGAIEDLGYGLLAMYASTEEGNFCVGTNVTALGVDIDRATQRDPRCIWISGNDWDCYRVLDTRISDKKMSFILANYLRETEEGRELRIRIFGGVTLQNDEFVRTPLPEGIDPVEVARLHMQHLMFEYGHEARLVNEFWEEYQAGTL